MALSVYGRPYIKVEGTKKYIWEQVRRARPATRGRLWIERNDQPAVRDTSAAYRISRFVLADADDHAP